MHPTERFFQDAAEGYEYRIVTTREKKPCSQLLDIEMPKKKDLRTAETCINQIPHLKCTY